MTRATKSKWLNTEVSYFDGLCIGVGATKAEAVANALATLEARIAELKGLAE